MAGEASALERAGYEALRKFDTERIESLFSAMKNVQKVKALMANNHLPKEYYPHSPEFALETMLAKMWQQQVLEGHQGRVKSANFSPDGKYIVTASDDGTAKIWKSSGQQIQTLRHQDVVNNAMFSLNGQRIITISADKTGKIWDLSGRLIKTLPHQGRVNGVVFSSDGQHILTVSFDKTARVWDLSGNLIVTLQGHRDIVNSGMFSADGKHIVTASADNTARVWDLSGRLIKTLQHQGIINSASFSPDGKTILTASADNTVKLWDFQGKEIDIIRGQGVFWNASFSPDGKYIVTASDDNIAQLWIVEENNIRRTRLFPGVNSATFSPDGQYVASISSNNTDNTVKIWNLEGKEIAILEGHRDKVWNTNFSPNGLSILTSSDDYTVRMWFKSQVNIALNPSSPNTNKLSQLLLQSCSWFRGYFAYASRINPSSSQLCDVEQLARSISLKNPSSGNEYANLLPLPRPNRPNITPIPPITLPRLSPPSVSHPLRTENSIVVAIDPGHGGKESGGIGIGGLQEKDITLPVSIRLAQILQQKGIQVVMTRNSDYFVELQGRVDIAERANADVFVSIHANSTDTHPEIFNGLEIYYYDSGINLASKVQNSILTKTQARNRGIRKARFYILRKSSMPSILIEMGYITSNQDAPKLQTPEYQNRMAEAIADGIIQYLNQR